MWILGLTGPSGAGKTTASAVLQREGFAAVDADRVARRVERPGEPCLKKLAAVFGRGILNPDGSLNRRALAAQTFSSPERVRLLNAVTHPFILEQIEHRLGELRAGGTKWALLDAPTLFQSGADAFCNRVAVVVAPAPERLRRLCGRDDLTPAEARRRMDAVPDGYFLSRADDVLDNDCGPEEFERRVRAYARRVKQAAGAAGKDAER